MLEQATQEANPYAFNAQPNNKPSGRPIASLQGSLSPSPQGQPYRKPSGGLSQAFRAAYHEPFTHPNTRL